MALNELTMGTKLVMFSVVYFVAVILVAHFFAHPGYAWAQNTISELASQGHRHKWIMQLGFIGFGLLLSGGLVLKSIDAKRIHYPDILLGLYGLAIIVTGFFCEKPIAATISYSVKEASIHSAFATVAGISLSLGMLGYLLMAATPSERVFHAVFLALVVGFSMLFGLTENETIGIGKGIVQRGLYLVSFVWLLVGQWFGFGSI